MKSATQFGKLLGSVGLVGGMFYAIKGNKKTQVIAMYGILFGLGGFLIGNAINKFYEA